MTIELGVRDPTLDSLVLRRSQALSLPARTMLRGGRS